MAEFWIPKMISVSGMFKYNWVRLQYETLSHFLTVRLIFPSETGSGRRKQLPSRRDSVLAVVSSGRSPDPCCSKGERGPSLQLNSVVRNHSVLQTFNSFYKFISFFDIKTKTPIGAVIYLITYCQATNVVLIHIGDQTKNWVENLIWKVTKPRLTSKGWCECYDLFSTI